MWEVEPCERHRHMIIELDYPLLETGEAILLSKLTLSVCGSKQVEALQWEPHDKVTADDRHIVIEAPLYQTMSFKIPKLRMVEAKGKWVRSRRVYQVVVNMGASYGSLRATDFTAAAKKDDATVKWYHDSNAEISVGVPMAPPLPTDDATNGILTSRVTWEVEPCEKHRHMIIELDYPLLETGEAILLSKLTLGVCGSKQVEALLWRTLSFKIPKLRMVEAKGEWVRGRRVYKLSVYFHGPKKIRAVQETLKISEMFEITSKQSIDPPLSRGYTLGSGEDNMKLIGIDEILLKLVLSVLVSAVKRMLMLLVQVSAIEVNPVIYTFCIEQFCATAKVQTVNGVRQLQALVDKKRVIVTESSIRRYLHLDDAEGTDCLPTATIFKELARKGYEKPSQKLTFYKAFFSPQWKYYIRTITECLSSKSTV
ncbi:hypothetical protein Tco_0697900 [Tanacetum coccineum]